MKKALKYTRSIFIPVFIFICFLLPVQAVLAGKPVVGLAAIQTAAQNISCRGWDAVRGRNCNGNLAEGFRIMLETAIVKTNKMLVMERSQMEKVMSEQVLGQAGLTTRGGKVGGLVGVDYMIYGSITKFGVRTSDFSIGRGQGLTSLFGQRTQRAIGDIGSKQVATQMAVDIKVTDVSNGQIILADTVSGEAEQGQAFRAGGITIQGQQGDPFANVQRLVAAKIAEAVATSRIPFKVIKVQQDGVLILNYGNVFLQAGDQLELFEVGEQFIDPDTGDILGAEEKKVGIVEVQSVEKKFSKAIVRSTNQPVKVGSVLRRVKSSDDGSIQRSRSGDDFFDD